MNTIEGPQQLLDGQRQSPGLVSIEPTKRVRFDNLMYAADRQMDAAKRALRELVSA